MTKQPPDAHNATSPEPTEKPRRKRRQRRPAKPPREVQHDAHLSLRVSAELLRRLDELAERCRVSRTDLVRSLLEGALPVYSARSSGLWEPVDGSDPLLCDGSAVRSIGSKRLRTCPGCLRCKP